MKIETINFKGDELRLPTAVETAELDHLIDSANECETVLEYADKCCHILFAILKEISKCDHHVSSHVIADNVDNKTVFRCAECNSYVCHQRFCSNCGAELDWGTALLIASADDKKIKNNDCNTFLQYIL